jgi:hypothetical protein
MGHWNPHKNPKDNKGFESVSEIVCDIAERAFGGWDDFTDDIRTYPLEILKLYKSEDCPEPLNEEVYQDVLRDYPERVHRAIHRRICSRIY